jgi:hypothetical protein
VHSFDAGVVQRLLTVTALTVGARGVEESTGVTHGEQQGQTPTGTLMVSRAPETLASVNYEQAPSPSSKVTNKQNQSVQARCFSLLARQHRRSTRRVRVRYLAKPDARVSARHVRRVHDHRARTRSACGGGGGGGAGFGGVVEAGLPAADKDDGRGAAGGGVAGQRPANA